MVKLKGGPVDPSRIKPLAAATAAPVAATAIAAAVAAAAARFLHPFELHISPFVTAPPPTAAGPASFLE